MKIRINEDQYKMLQSHKMEENFNSYINGMKKKVEIINKIHNKLMFITISEVITGEINLDEINSVLSDIDTKLSELKTKADAIIDPIFNTDEDKYSELENIILEVYYPIDKKITHLTSLISELKDIWYLEDDNGFSKSFTDIKPLEV